MKRSTKKPRQKEVIIGFDFDKIFVDYPPLIPDSLINWLYKKPSKTLKYRYPGTLEQQLRILSHLPLFRHPIWKNIGVLEKLSQNENIKMHVVSSRFKFLQKRTEQWLQKFPISKHFVSLNFNYRNEQPHAFKNKMINQLNIQYFIDDDLDSLLYFAEKNPNKQFFWLNPSGTTKHYIPFRNITMIKNLTELPTL